MNTSTTIKQGQYQPIQGTRNGANSWTFASETRERTRYSVLRDGKAYRCGCPATGLCKHITSAVMDDAKPKFQLVQIWTSYSDAVAQKRRMLEMTANGHRFWVTYAKENPLAGVIRFCQTWGTWGEGSSVDLYYQGDNGDRREVIDADFASLEKQAMSEGWKRRGLYLWREWPNR